MCILRVFLKTSIFASSIGPTTTLARNGQNCWVRCGNDAPWDLRWNLYAELSLVPRSLETRTKRGFPHSHSDYGGGTSSARKQTPLNHWSLSDSCTEPHFYCLCIYRNSTSHGISRLISV
jgi:hypothetical protein